MSTANLPDKCDFCGEPLVDCKTNERLLYLEAGGVGDENSKVLCQRCIKKAWKIIGGKIEAESGGVKTGVEAKAKAKPGAKVVLPVGFKVQTPKEIFAQLRQYVIGQEDYLIDVSVWAYSHCKRLQEAAEGKSFDNLPPRNNMLVIGPTGSGKTHVMNTLAKIIGLPIVIADVTGITEAGYVGQDIEDVLKKLLSIAGGNVELMQCGIVVLDEVDKLASKQTSFKDVSGTGVQESILKLVSGSDLSTITISASSSKYQAVKRDEAEITTAYMAFAACGAFSGLKSLQRERTGASIGFRRSDGVEIESDKEDVSYTLTDDHALNEDLTKHGMLPEFLGRFSYKSILAPLSVDDLEKIMTEPKDSIIHKEAERFASEGIEFKVTTSAIHEIAVRAHKEKLGARTLSSGLAKIVRNVAFDTFGSGDVARVEVCVNAQGKLHAKVLRKALVVG